MNATAAATARTRPSRRPFEGLITDQNYMWWASIPIMLGMFLVVMDATIVNVALPHILAAFGGSVEDLEWVSTGYMLSAAVMMPTTGFLGDRFGRKRLYSIATVLFTVLSGFCGLAWNLGSLVLFRVLQGVVGGAIQPLGQSLLYEAFPRERRGVAMAIIGFGAMMAPALGPTLGGYLVDNLSWRSIFYINLPVGILASFLSLAILRESPMRKASFDFWGFLLMATFLPTLLLAISQGNSKGWHSFFIIGLFAVSAVAFGAFLIVVLWRQEPIVDLSIFANVTYAAGTISGVVLGIGLFGATFLLPLFLQNIQGLTAFQTGLLMLPQGAVMGLVMPISGALIQRIEARIQLGIGMALLSGSMFLQAHLNVATPPALIILWTIIGGTGRALAFPAMNVTSLSAVPIRKIGQATGLYNVTRQVGGAFGVAIVGTVLIQRQIFHQCILGQAMAITDNVHGFLAHASQLLITGGASPYTAHLQAAMALGQLAAKQASVWAFQDSFRVAGMVSILGIIPAFFMKPRNSDPQEDQLEALAVE